MKRECFELVFHWELTIGDHIGEKRSEAWLSFSFWIQTSFFKHHRNISRHLTHYLIYKHEKIIFLFDIFFFLVYDACYRFSVCLDFVLLLLFLSWSSSRWFLCLHVCLACVERGIVSESKTTSREHEKNVFIVFCIQLNK